MKGGVMIIIDSPKYAEETRSFRSFIQKVIIGLTQLVHNPPDKGDLGG